MFEPIEPRLLLSADITYGNPLGVPLPSSIDATAITDFLDSVVANATTLDFTLKAESIGGAERWALYKTGTSTLITEVSIDNASDLTLNLTRDDLGLTSDTGLNLKDFVPDTLRIDLGSLEVLETDYAGGAIQINFDGGSQVLSLLGIDDDVLLEGTADLGLSLGVKSNSDISLTNVGLAATAITIDSDNTNGGLYDDIDEILAGADSSVLLDKTDLSATGGITLKARSNITANSDGFDLGSVSIVGVASFSTSRVELKNGSTVNAGGALALTADVVADIDAITGTQSVKIAGVLGAATPEVIVTGGTLTAGNGANLAATSNLNILASTKPNAGSNSTTSDAAVAIIGFDSSPTVELTGGAALTVNSGNATLAASNTVVMQAIADGRIGGSAGGTLGVSTLLGDTSATVNNATITSNGSINITATSVRTLTTTAHASPEGAEDSGGANESEKRLDDPNQDGNTSDKASTGDGDVGFAAAVAVTILTGDSLATIDNSEVASTGVGNLTLAASATNTTTTTGNGSAKSDSGSGVGVGVAIAVADVGAEAWLKGTSEVDVATANVTATMPQSTFTANAKSGASGGSSGLGVAGSLVVNVTLADAKAGVANGASIDLNGSNLNISATSTTDSNAKAEAGASGGDSSLGMGASVAINYAENETLALLDTNATVNSLQGIGGGTVGTVTLAATSNHGMKTEAIGGSAGGTAITPVAALSFATYDTLAQLRSDSGVDLVTTGTVSATAAHTGDVQTSATGKTSGDTAIGASFALAVHGATALADTQRDVNTNGSLNLTATNKSNTKTSTTASAKGSSDNGGNVDSQAADQRNSGKGAGESRGADKDTDSTGSTPSASSSEGNVAVAAAVSINVVNTDARAAIGASRSITAGGNVAVRSAMNNDVEATASGEAVTDGSAGVGAAVALNFVDADNVAEVGNNAIISADGLAVSARAADTALGAEQTHTTKGSTTSGAGAKDVGVAGSITVNVVDVETTARTGSGVNFTLNNGAVDLQALSVTANDATAAPNDTGVEADVGIGASVAFQTITTDTLAEVGSGGTVSGTGGALKVDAKGTHTVTTNATHGASGDSVAVGGAVAIALVDHSTRAKVNAGGAFSNLTGDVDVTATHTSTVTTATKADVKSNSVGVGAGIGINYDEETVEATLSRSVNTSGSVDVITLATVNAVATGTASASGGDDSDGDADSESDKAVNDNANNGGDKTLPKAADAETTGDTKASGESGSGSSGGASGVGVAAAISVNAVFLTASAETASGADITASGAVTVAADASLDAKAQTDAMAVDFSNGNVNIGAAVSLNYVELDQTARVGGGSSVSGSSVAVRAETLDAARNDFSATAYAAGGNSSGAAAVAATLGLNVVNYKVRAYTADNSSVSATGGGVTVSAEHDMGVLAGAVSGSVSADGVAVGGSVAMNFINVGDDPAQAYDAGTFASIGDGSGGGTASATATGTVSVKTDTLVDTVQLDLPEKLNNFDDSDADYELDDPDIHLSTLAIAAGGSGGSAGVAGSVSFNWFNVISEALVDNGATVNANALAVKADDEVHVTSIAGSVGVGASGSGVGAGLDIVIIDRATNARVGSGALVTLGSGASSVEAESDETLIGVSANVGVGNSAGVAGSAGVHVINTASWAGTHASVAGTVNGTGDFRIDASGDYTDKMVAGSIGAGSTAGIGAANTTLVHTHTVRAGIAGSGTVNLTGSGADVVIEATSTESVLGITAAGSGGGTAAVGGAVVVGVITQNTDAYVDRGGTVNATLGNVSVLADADTVLTAVAGNVNLGGTAGVGVGVDVGVVNKTTQARMESNVDAEVFGNLRVVATSSEDITSVVAGLSAGGTAAVAANPSIHSLNLATLAHIGDDPLTGAASSGAGDVSVAGSIEITADDATEVDKVSGGVAVGGSAGVALSASVSVINKRTEAFIGAGAEVDAIGLGAGVDSALGVITAATAASSAATNHADVNSSATYDGNAASVGASSQVGAPSIDDGGGDTATDQAKSDVEVDRTTQLGSFNVKGIAISATNRDDVASYSLSLAIGGGAGVGISGAVTVVNTATRAYIDDNARVNSPNSNPDADQSVRLGAGNDFEHVGIVVGAGGGTVGVGAGVDVTVLSATTEAYIDDGAIVRAANDVTVDAHSNEDVVLVNAGVAGGLVGVGGTVGVLTITNTTTAKIDGGATVSAGDSVGVRANDDTKTVTVDGAVAGGFVGVGAAVGVLVVTKDTTASIEGGATVDALGNGGGLGDVYTGALSGGDSADGFARAGATGVVVQASSKEDIKHFVIAGGGGFVGVGGAVGVTVIDSDTQAKIGAASINQNNLGGSAQDVTVNAANEVRLTSVVGAIAGGFVGAAGAVDVGVVRNDVGAFIRSGANVRAGGDVEVNGLAIKELDGFTASAAGGAVGVSGAVAVWSIGTDTVSGYDADGNGSISQSEKPGETGTGVSADEDAGAQSQKSLEGSRGLWNGYGSDGSDPANRSRTEATSAMGNADNRLDDGDMPSQGNITGKVNAPAQLAGTQAIIEGGATVRSGVSGGITVHAKADVEIDMFMGQFAFGVVGAGGAVGVVSIQEKVEAVAAGTLWAGGAIDVYAHLDSEMNFLSIAGNGGAVALGASVVALTDSSVVIANIGDSAVIDNAGSISVKAESDREVGVENLGVTVGLVAVGASVGVVGIEGSVTAAVGANARIGQDVFEAGTVGSIAVRADANEFGHADATALAAGVNSGAVNVAVVNVTTAVTAELEAGAQVTTSGPATVDAVSVMDGDASLTGVAVGFGGSLAASIATVNVTPTITAAARSNSKLQSTSGQTRIRASHNETGSKVVEVETIAGSGDITFGAAGSVSTANHNATVLASAEGGSQVLAGGTAELSAFSGAKALADAGSLGIGALALGTSTGLATVGGSVRAEFSGATLGTGQNVVVRTDTDLDSDAVTAATTGGVIGINTNQATATVNTSVTTRVDSGVVTASNAVTLDADANAQASANSGGIETADEDDFPSISLFGSVGFSASDAVLDSTVTTEIGSAQVTANGLLTVRATHNEGNSHRAFASASASGGSLGVAVSGADADATSSANTFATVGAGATLHGGGGIVVKALGMNQAEAIVDALGFGGVAGIGESDATAITNGGAEAKVADGSGSGAGQHATLTGLGLTVDADSIDRSRAVANGAGGGIAVGVSGNVARAYTAPRTVAEVGQFAVVNVGGALAVTADAATEADASTEGSQGGLLAGIGDSTASVHVGDKPGNGDEAVVAAIIDDSAQVLAGSADVFARHNQSDALNNLQAVLGGTTNGESKATANSSGGGFAGVSNAYASGTVRTNVDAKVDLGASVQTGGAVRVGSESNANVAARGVSAQGGAGAFGEGYGQVYVRQDVDTLVGSNAVIDAGGGVALTALENAYTDTFGQSDGGGAISVADAKAEADLFSSAAVAIGDNASVHAQGNLRAEAEQRFGGAGFATSESWGAGVSSYSTIRFDLNRLLAPGQNSASVTVGNDADLFSADELRLNAIANGGTINGKGDSFIGIGVGDTDTDVITYLNTPSEVNIGAGATVKGEDLVSILSQQQGFLQDSGNKSNGDPGIESDAAAIGFGDARFYFTVLQPTRVTAADTATVATRDLLVRTYTTEPSYSVSADENGINALDWEEFHANWSPTRLIDWDADVILLSGPVPELVVDPSGFIAVAENVTVDDGGVTKGQGGTIVNAQFTVNPIYNNDPGTAKFEANAVGNIFSGIEFADLGAWDGEANTNQTSQIFGDDGTWYARRTFDTVTLTNHSAKKMIISDIFPIDRDGDPDGEVFINVDDRSPAGKEPFNFRIVNQFEPTLITITSTNAAAVADIEFAGEVDNPIGHTEVTSASDIISNGSQLIRTNTITLNAALNIGNLVPFAFQDQTKLVGEASSRTPLRIDLVQSFNRPEDLDATAGRDIVLDVRGLKRQEGGAGFTVNLSNVDAGRNADVFMLNAREETTPAGVGSYALIIDENFNSGVDEIPFAGNTPDPLPYIQFFKPDDAGIVFDFWKNLTAPLGVFGTFTANTEATYDFGLVQAGRVTNGGDIQLNGELTGVDVNIRANTNIFGATTGLLFALTDGDIDFTETLGDMRLGRVKSSEGDVELSSPADIIDVEADDHLSTQSDANAEADVTGRSITLNALDGFIGEKWQGLAGLFTTTPVDFIEIDSSFSATGTVTATALKEIYLDELNGAMNLNLIRSLDTDVVLHTRAGGIADGNGAANNIRARSIDLVTVGGGVGTAADDVEIDTDEATLGGTTGRLYATATANGAIDAGIYLTELNDSLDVLRARTDKGDVRLSLYDTATVPAATLGEEPPGTASVYDDSFVRDVGENLIVLANGVTLENQSIADGRIEAERDVLLRVGDNVEMLGATTSFVLAGRNIDIFGDWGNADVGGTIMNLRGEVTSDFSSAANAKQVGQRTRLFGHNEADRFSFLQLKLGGETYAYGSQNAAAVLANDGQDRFLVDRLQDLTTTRGTYLDSAGNVLPVRDALTLDGQADTDEYIVVTHGSLNGNGGLGGISDYIVNALDTGASNDGEDTLTIDGSSGADIFLLRGQNYIPGHAADRPAFVALLHGDLEDDVLALGGDLDAQAANPNSPYLKVERVNYDQAMNGRLIAYGYGGDDYFASDDNSVITTLDGGDGRDRFQIGQLYRSEREYGNVQDANDFADATVLTTRGELSRGISAPMTIYGGFGNDVFSVYSNKAELRLEGNEGNDDFIIRAFALETGEGGDGETLIQGGEGDDNIQYNINAPVSIDGGPGFDRVVVLGTEFNDNFVITEDGIFGAGLKVTLAGNEELREIDGLEGDDNFWVLGTPFDIATRIIGGLGSDDVNAMGDVTGVVVSRDLEGVSSSIEHAVSADPLLDPFYNNMLARGVDLNIATAASGQIVIQEPDGRSVVSESALLGSITDSYEVYLSSAASAAVFVTVSAVRSPQQEQDGVPAGDTFLVSTDGVTWQRAIVLTFNAGQSGEAFKQQVFIKAVDDTRAEGRRTAVISHSSLSADPAFNWVAVRNVEVDIIDDDKAGIYLEESFAEYDNGTQVLEGTAATEIDDTYTVRLASAPTGNTTVTLAWDTAEIGLSTADARWNAGAKTLSFTAANWFVPVTFTIDALQDGVRENREIVPITHTVTASTDLRYVNPLTPTPDVTAEKLKVSVIDGDSEGVLVTESFNDTLLVQDNPATATDETKTDTYTVRLTKAPVGTVTVTTIPMSLPDADGGLVQTVFTLPTALVFNAANWMTAQEVTITANPDFQPAPGTEYDKQFTKRPHVTSELFGPLEFLGGVGPEDRSLVEPILLPGETNAMDSDGNVLSFTGPFEGGALNTMVVEKADLQAVADAVLTDDVTVLGDLVGFSIMITAGPGLDRFWQINAVQDLGNGQVQLTLENPGRLEERWNTTGAPNATSEYAVLYMSSTFFVDEAQQIDKLNVFNDTSVADDVGTVTVNRVHGLGMGPGASFDTNEDNVADLFFNSGISVASYTDNDPLTPNTYDDVEVVEVMLGRGNDLLTVESTLKTTADHGGLTVLHGGGNTPLVGGAMGGDTINVLARQGGSPLVVLGDTSADGHRYSGQSGIKSPHAMNFAFAGRDTLDAHWASESVTMYGGANNDLIIGSQVGDTLAGGSGDDRIFGQGGNDHVYGDSGVNIDVNTRLLVSGMNGPSLTDVAFKAPPWEAVEKTGHDRSQRYDASQTDDLTATVVDLARPSWADTLDGGADLILGEGGNDIVFGDHGIVTQAWAAGTPQLVRVTGTGTGEFATANERLVESRSNTNGRGDTIFGNTGDDVLIGGAAGDRVDGNEGQDLVFGDNVSLDRSLTVGNPTNPRFRVLQGTQMYSITGGDNAGVALVTAAWQAKPGATPVWTDYRVELLDHSFADEAAALNNFGNDYLAGGAQDDQLFGQLGNDTLQGDGAIGAFTPGAGADLAAQLRNGTVSATAAGASRAAPGLGEGIGILKVSPSTEAASDGDDYIEGNGGNDVVFGNLGQDDILGGSSTMFGETERSERPDGSDLLFGGAGLANGRNHFGAAAVDANGVVTVNANGHARDSDMMLGDNGDIHRLVGVTVNGSVLKAGMAASGTVGGVATSLGYLAYNYDVNGYPGTLRIIPRTATLVDYTPGGPDYKPASLPNGEAGDYGTGDELHGEAGDDFMYGMTGNDILYGEGQNDDMLGGWGADWISGGTGDDGVLGDDGRIFTSRNSASYGEPLYGVVSLVATDPDTRTMQGNVLNEVIYTPGNVQVSTIHLGGELKKAVDLSPFNVDPEGATGGIQTPLFAPQYANDIIFGGLGNDWLHGGSGDDAISGAEALPQAFSQTYNGAGDTLDGRVRSDYAQPFNTGDVLRFNPDDEDGWHRDRTRRAGEFALYDEYDPMRRIMLDANGEKWKTGAMPSGEFLLNFNINEGVFAPAGTISANGQQATSYVATWNDGNDRIFGDLGNDWLVGGTGRDQVYGGYGNDLLNADDNHTTNGSLNNQPDTAPSYEDRAFGGAGRDVLIANTGGDRLIDWVGEFNSYLVPFAPFGTATVSRTLQPQLAEFLYAQSRSDGADFTRAADTGADPARNGEPYGELGLVRQEDKSAILQAQGADFHSQTGAPADPQAGNIPGGKRDVLRSASFDGNKPDNLMADSGTWQVSSGKLQVAATSNKADAVAVYHIGDALPSYFEVSASISTIKPTAGWNANSYVIFDYVSYKDFKYAGIDISTNKLVIGQRDANGWQVLKQTPFQGKVDTFYNVLLQVNGTSAYMTVGKTVLSHTFAARTENGIAYGLNWGLVGFGSNKARGSLDSIAVLVVPPAATVAKTEAFTSGLGQSFTDGATAGTWTVTNGRALASPSQAGTATVAAMNLNGVERMATSSLLEMSVTLNTAHRAGVVFDRYSDADYKFAAIDVATQQLLIGHVRGGTVTIDSAVPRALTGGTDYTLNLTLKGSTVSANVALTSTQATLAMTSFVFNAVAVDGRFGLFARGGNASFDSATVSTNDAAVPAAQVTAFSGSGIDAGSLFNETELGALKAEAIRRWTQVEDAFHLSGLASLDVVMADLPDGQVGEYANGRITLDVDADGHGWFVDATPDADDEFTGVGSVLAARIGSSASDRIDMLTVLVHEMGHAIGLGHSDGGVMDDTVLPGQRATPDLWYGMSAAPAAQHGRDSVRGGDELLLSNPSVQKSGNAVIAIDWSQPVHSVVGVQTLQPSDGVRAWQSKFVGDQASDRTAANSALKIVLPVTAKVAVKTTLL